jgi:hypothetical protein
MGMLALAVVVHHKALGLLANLYSIYPSLTRYLQPHQIVQKLQPRHLLS